MRRIVLLLVLSGVTLQAYSYLAFEQITVAAASIGFTSTKITAVGGGFDPTVAICTLRTAEISYTYDGTTPTSSVGQLLEPGQSLTINGHDVLAKFRAIRTGATSGQLDCTYSAP